MARKYSEIDEVSFDAEELLNPQLQQESAADSSANSPFSEPRPRPQQQQQQPAAPEPVRQEAPSPQRQEPREAEAAETTSFDKADAISLLRKVELFGGVVLFFLSAYTLIVMFSYLLNIRHDLSSILGGTLEPAEFTNVGGPFGSWIAHYIIYRWVGVSGFLLIYYLGVVSLRLLHIISLRFWNFTLKCLLSIVSISIISGAIETVTEAHSPVFWGGLHGYLVNQWLDAYTGYPGVIAVSAILCGLLAVMFIDTLKKVFGWINRAVQATIERRRRERLEREEYERQHQPETAPEPQTQSQPTAGQAETGPSEQEVIEKKENEHQSSAVNEQSDSLFESAQSDVTDQENDVPLFSEEYDENMISAEESEEEIVTGPAAENGDDPVMVVEKPVIETCEPIAVSDVYDPTAELSRYEFPSLDLLKELTYSTESVDATEMEENKLRITKTLNDYGIPISHIHATVGPTVTLYEIIPAEGVRIAKIKRLEDDIAMSLAALGIRIIAPIPGKGTIGIEVPNKDAQTVSIRSILSSRKFQESRMELPMAMGCTISNEVFMADLCKMPHLLVAGATGMGKSVGLNTIIASLLYKKHPSQLKFVLIDPKMVEFSLYSKLENHYLAKLPGDDDAIITDPQKVVATLNSLCIEMDDRYSLLKMAGCRNIKEYNDRFVHRTLNPEKGHRYMPYIVVIVDEFADLIMTAGKEVETPIARIAQKARAVGIHMILATQRPSTNVITGVIKANFPGRIAFRVFQMVDSRTILDRPGANQLIGRGDMLFSNNGKIDRVQCAFIDTPEVEAICEAIGSQPGYGCPYPLPEYVPDNDGQAALGGNPSDRDPLFGDAARYVSQTDTASTSSLQRRYSIGYNRAGKIMDQLEAAGIVGPAQGGKPRQVLMDSVQIDRYLSNSAFAGE